MLREDSATFEDSSRSSDNDAVETRRTRQLPEWVTPKPVKFDKDSISSIRSIDEINEDAENKLPNLMQNSSIENNQSAGAEKKIGTDEDVTFSEDDLPPWLKGPSVTSADDISSSHDDDTDDFGIIESSKPSVGNGIYNMLFGTQSTTPSWRTEGEDTPMVKAPPPWLSNKPVSDTQNPPAATSPASSLLPPWASRAAESVTEFTAEFEGVNRFGPPEDQQSMLQMARKAGVAVTGGAMVGVGMVMIPLPTPFGFAVAGAGMAVLGTEFPAAQQALDSTRDTLVEVIEKNCLDKEPETSVKNEDGRNNTDLNDIENVGVAIKKTLKGVGQKALPIIKAIGTQSEDQENDVGATR